MLIAMNIEAMLQAIGCVIVGPAGRLQVAQDLAASETLDAAILDVNIRGESILPVAETLADRGIPFVLASGYGDWALPEPMKGRPQLPKPYAAAELKETILSLCAQSARRR